MYKLASLSLLALSLAALPALAQNRFMDEAKENAARRAENAAVRAAENPQPAKPAANPQQASSPQPTSAQTATAEPQAAPAQQPAPAQ
jgi:hypothetical protein